MSTYGAVRASFNSLLGVSGDDIQTAYNMQGDWCAMTVWVGFRNAGALDNLAGGLKTAEEQTAGQPETAEEQTAEASSVGASETDSSNNI